MTAFNLTVFLRQLNRLTELLSAFQAAQNRVLGSAQAQQRDAEQKYSDFLQRSRQELLQVTNRCENEAQSRRRLAAQHLNHMKLLTDSIPDPNWSRVRARYYRRAAQAATADYSHLPIAELSDLLSRTTPELESAVDQLHQSQLSRTAISVIGRLAPSFRHRQYESIALLREQLIRCAEALCNDSDLVQCRQTAEASQSQAAARFRQDLLQRTASLPAQTEAALRGTAVRLNAALAQLDESGVFNHNRPLHLGRVIWADPHRAVLPRLTGHVCRYVQGNALTFAASADRIDANLLLTGTADSPLSDTFSSLAIDILTAAPNSEIFMLDCEGLGSHYAVLSRVAAQGSLTVFRTAEEASAGLAALSRLISQMHSDVLGDAYPSLDAYNAAHPEEPHPYRYLFAENLAANLSGSSLDAFCRIVQYGRAAGVQVICSVRTDLAADRTFADRLPGLLRSSLCLPVESGCIPLGQNTVLQLPAAPTAQRIDRLCSRLSAYKSRRVVIPVGPALPPAPAWHSADASLEICLPIGCDPSGKTVFLTLTEKKPYALIIGDMDTGKSSLLHAIILQTLTRYNEDEVKILIGDFKNGAEFNIYADSCLKAVEAVVNDTDPDVMQSFLRYAVTEMQRRQELFNRLSEETGHIVRKYETYRQLHQQTGSALPAMGRILLIIDEYQSLFDNVPGTAALLCELVRQGRGYGVHLVMASQRALSSDPRNSFPSDLKDMFTYRVVFRSPQSAARTMLSERCSDTARENSGIMAASLLENGHAILNSYMGQNEKDNRRVQCFYSDDTAIETACQALVLLRGRGTGILLRQGLPSLSRPCADAGMLHLGLSPCLRRDVSVPNASPLRDDHRIGLLAGNRGIHLLCVGADERVFRSAAFSALQFVSARSGQCSVHVFAAPENPNLVVLHALFGRCGQVHFHLTPEDQKAALTDQLNQPRAGCLNLFPDIADCPQFGQSSGGYRTTPESELLQQVLARRQGADCFSVFGSSSYKSVRTGWPFLITACGLRLAAVGDMENVKAALPESWRPVSSAFDIPQNDAVKAYYACPGSEKFGKIILYSPDRF